MLHAVYFSKSHRALADMQLWGCQLCGRAKLAELALAYAHLCISLRKEWRNTPCQTRTLQQQHKGTSALSIDCGMKAFPVLVKESNCIVFPLKVGGHSPCAIVDMAILTQHHIYAVTKAV